MVGKTILSALPCGIRVSEDEGQGCQRIGLAFAMQRRAINVAVTEHKNIKHVIACLLDMFGFLMFCNGHIDSPSLHSNSQAYLLATVVCGEDNSTRSIANI